MNQLTPESESERETASDRYDVTAEPSDHWPSLSDECPCVPRGPFRGRALASPVGAAGGAGDFWVGQREQKGAVWRCEVR